MKYRWAFARKAEVSTVKMPENLTEVKLRQTDIYTGKILKLHIDDVRLPNGREAVREVVDHVDGAAVLALDEENRALVVWQYRYVFGRTLLEIPAGKREPGEDPLTTARRELREETGAEATHWQPLGAVLPSPGCYGEVLHLYLARDLTFGATHPDADEFLQVRRLPFDTLLARCLSGEIEDGKTVAAVLKAKLLGL